MIFENNYYSALKHFINTHLILKLEFFQIVFFLKPKIFVIFPTVPVIDPSIKIKLTVDMVSTKYGKKFKIS